MRPAFELVVVGGGPVGAALATLAVRHAGIPATRVAIIEREPPPTWHDDAPADLRVVALSRASIRVLEACGAWEGIAAARTYPYEHMHVWHERHAPRSPQALVFDAAEFAEPDLGCIVENRLIQARALEAAAAEGVELVSEPLEALTFEDRGVQVDAGPRRLDAALVVGADGGSSRVRELAGLGVRTQAYGQTALVANVRAARAHEDSCWQRFLGYGTLALLPLAPGECSIVWSVLDAEADRLRGLSDAGFEAALTQASDEVLGALRLTSARRAFPLTRQSALHYVRERVALVGDAAHVIHPLAGQGVNLGFLDAAALADALASARREREDPGALRVLRPYERARKAENELMALALDAFDRFLATGSGPVARVAQAGLGWVNRAPEIRREFASRALGLAGNLPGPARRRA
jgi:2-octaprenylphenol hydroxylase